MKNPFNEALLLGTTIFMFGCSSSEDQIVNNPPPDDAIQSWTVSVQATGNGISGMEETDEQTRAVFYGGNNGHRFSFIWDDGDAVEVYKGGTLLGTLTPSVTGQETTTLTGTLTGAIAVDDVLDLYMPGRAYDYSDQDASLGDLSLRHAFQQSSTVVTEAKESGNTLSLETTRMDHAQAYWWLRLTDENGDRLHPTRLQIYGTSGKMVKTKAIDGTTTYYTDADPMDITIAKSDDNGEYPGEAFLAIRNESGSADTYKFKAWVGEDVYVGPYDRALTYNFPNRVMANVMRQMRKTTAASTLAITDIPEKVFTGYAIEPTLTVKDGETTLTLDTDYSVAYTDNVNVGTATATITGLAEQGTTCTTPYLGTQDKTFNIVQAVPVITMPTTADMTLEVGLTRNRAVTSVTLDNSAYGIADLDIMAAPYNCTVTYTSDDESVASVAADGTVTGVATGTTTIHVNVASAANWTSQTTSYVVKVSPRVNTSGNASWTVTEDAEDGNLYQ